MQKTIRVLRIALPVAFGLFLLIIVLSWNRKNVGRDQSVNEPIVPTRPADKPRAQSTKFRDTQTIGGRLALLVEADRVVSYQSEWNTLENVRITIYRANGLTYDILCPSAQYNTATKEADAKGGVKVTSSDGVEISTAEIKSDGNRLTNDIPVQFKIDRWQGNAGALDIDVQAETIQLLKTVTATMTAEKPNDPPMTLKGAESLFRRRENDVTFTREVEMTRAADRLTGDRITGRFTPDRRNLLGLDGNGQIAITMGSNTLPGEDVGGRKHITCDRFYTDLGGDGLISAINALGEPGLAHAVLDGPPKRDIVARTFKITMANRAVSAIYADWDVVMKELGATAREIRADHVNVTFDPVRHRATTAAAAGGFKYSDAKTSASSVRANFDIVNDRVLLTAQPGFNPTVVFDGQTVKATQIEFSPRAGEAKASGSVIAQVTSKGGSDATNVFPTSTPVYVNADQLLLRQAAKTATFTGKVKAWQETNTLFAQELQVQNNGQVISARGAVRTLLYNAGSEPRKAPLTTNSEQLIARRNERRVELIGAVQMEDEARTLAAEKATLFFDTNRKIDRVEAENKVVLVEKAMNRKVTGDKAVYHLNKKMAYLDGSPATATDPTGSLSGQQIQFDLARNRLQVVSPTAPTRGTYKQQ